MDVSNQPALSHRLADFPCVSRQGQLIIMQIVQFRALNAADRSCETSLHYFVVQSDDFK